MLLALRWRVYPLVWVSKPSTLPACSFKSSVLSDRNQKSLGVRLEGLMNWEVRFRVHRCHCQKQFSLLNT